MPVVSFVIPEEPQGQPRATQFTDRAGNRRAFIRKLKDPVTGKMTREHPSVAWRREVEKWAKTYTHPDWPLPQGEPVALILQFRKARPKKTKFPDFWVTKPDYDNLSKGVSDALSGIAYHDDRQVVRAYSRQNLGLGGNSPPSSRPSNAS